MENQENQRIAVPANFDLHIPTLLFVADNLYAKINVLRDIDESGLLGVDPARVEILRQVAKHFSRLARQVADDRRGIGEALEALNQSVVGAVAGLAEVPDNGSTQGVDRLRAHVANARRPRAKKHK